MQSHVSHHSEITGGKKFSSVGLKDIYISWGWFFCVIFVAKVKGLLLPSSYLCDFGGHRQV